MKILVRIHEAFEAPRGYGFCWHDRWRQEIVCAPVGINLVVAFVRWLWLWTAFYATSWLAKREPPRK